MKFSTCFFHIESAFFSPSFYIMAISNFIGDFILISYQMSTTKESAACGVRSDQVDFILEAMKCCFCFFLNIKSIFTSQWIKQIKCIYRKNTFFRLRLLLLHFMYLLDVLCVLYIEIKLCKSWNTSQNDLNWWIMNKAKKEIY